MTSNLVKSETQTSLRIAMSFLLTLGVMTMTDINLKSYKNNVLKTSVALVITIVQVTLANYFYLDTVWFYAVNVKTQLLKVNTSMLLVTEGVGLVIYFSCASFQTALYWYYSKDLKKYADDFGRFENMYQSRTGYNIAKPLMARSTAVLMVLITIFASGFGTVYWILFVDSYTYFQLFYKSDDILKQYTTVLWCLLCRTIRKSAQQLREDFIRDFRHGCTDARVTLYETLWLRLTMLSRRMSGAMGVLYAINILQELPMVFLNFYVTVLNLISIYEKMQEKEVLRISTFFDQKVFKWSPLVYGIYTVGRIWVCVDAAHAAQYEIDIRLKQAVLSEIPRCYMHSDKVNQLKHFLKKLMSFYPNIVIFKSITVNRTFMGTLLLQLMNYTCTMIQFYDAVSHPRINDVTSNTDNSMDLLQNCTKSEL